MTPIAEPASNAEELYNIAHKKTRATVERCIGLLKSRFRCLSKERVLFYSPQKSGIIIYACIVLHNHLISARVPFNERIEESESHIDDEISPVIDNILNEARRQRARIVEAFRP